MNKFCQANFAVFNTTLICPNNCGDHGSCTSKGCQCHSGYSGNDCSMKMQCIQKCNEHSYCTKNAICACYPGWSGENCQEIIGCPHNCTSATNGVCQANRNCQCLKPWTGDSCDQKPRSHHPLRKRLKKKLSVKGAHSLSQSSNTDTNNSD